MMKTEADSDDAWHAATFEGARDAQDHEFAARPFAERLRWVCEMSELIRRQSIAEGRTPPALDPDRHR